MRVLNKTLKGFNLINGWGVNDADYNVSHFEVINGKKKQVRCPIYSDWVGIIERSHCPIYKTKNPTYKDVTASEDFRHFMDYRKWVLEEQPNKNWMNCEPDKDILIFGNKIYDKTTLVYIDKKLNSFLTSSEGSRSGNMLGATFIPRKKINQFQAQCQNPFGSYKGEGRHLGYFPTELDAHLAWKARKHEIACIFAEQQTDPRVADALRKRYAPDTDWTKR